MGYSERGGLSCRTNICWCVIPRCRLAAARNGLLPRPLRRSELQKVTGETGKCISIGFHRGHAWASHFSRVCPYHPPRYSDESEPVTMSLDGPSVELKRPSESEDAPSNGKKSKTEDPLVAANALAAFARPSTEEEGSAAADTSPHSEDPPPDKGEEVIAQQVSDDDDTEATAGTESAASASDSASVAATAASRAIQDALNTVKQEQHVLAEREEAVKRQRSKAARFCADSRARRRLRTMIFEQSADPATQQLRIAQMQQLQQSQIRNQARCPRLAPLLPPPPCPLRPCTCTCHCLTSPLTCSCALPRSSCSTASMPRARLLPSRFKRRSTRRRCPTCMLTKRPRRVSPSSPTLRARPSPCRRSCWRRTAPRGTRSPPRRCPSPLRSRRPPLRTPRWVFPRRAPSPPPSASPPPPPPPCPPSARLGSSARSPPAPASSGRRSSSTEVDTPPPPPQGQPRPSRAPRAQRRSRSSAPPLRQRRPTRRRPTTSRRPRSLQASCHRRARRLSCPDGAEASGRGRRLRQRRARRCPRIPKPAFLLQ